METEGVSILWKNLRVTVDIKTQHVFRRTTHTAKEIIHDECVSFIFNKMNGFAEQNSLVAIMGASGSGKSTLMSALANRQSGDFKVDGDIQLNGLKMSPELMKTISGFVYQDDLFVPILTVSEHLHLAARIKLDRRISTEHRRTLVDEMLTDVGLTECANRFIGTSSDGEEKLSLSGGERKRLSVATELVTNPALLFCDEPTTGLDSFSALKLMTIMRNMTTQRAKTIICSIHQPSEKILDLFHQIILLYDGKVAFCGTTENALKFFQSIGYFYNKEQNPADYLVKNISIVSGREVESSNRAAHICLKFEESQYSDYVNERIERECNGTKNFGELKNTDHISWFLKFYWITYREVLHTIRDPSIQLKTLIQHMVIALGLGLCMKKTVIMDQESVQSIKGILCVAMCENFYSSLYISLDHFLKKIPMFIREYSNKMNTPLIFYLSNNISVIPGFVLNPIMFSIIFYMSLDIPKTWFIFLIITIVNVLVFHISGLFGIWLSLATNSISTAQTFILITKSLFNPFIGMTMNVRSIPAIFVWIRYISWVSYGFESLLIAYFYNIEYIQCPKAADAPCLKNGQEVLTSMGFDIGNLQRNMIIMGCIYLVLHLFSFIALKIRLYLKING